MGDKKMERKSISKSSQRSLTLTNVESLKSWVAESLWLVKGENE